MNMNSSSTVAGIFVIDTDCIIQLLSSAEGRIVLKHISIAIPPFILNELTGKNQETLKKLTRVEIVELTDEDREYAAKLIRKINQKKEFETWYLQRRMLGKIRHVGESEGAAIARRLGIDFVILDQNARAVIKIAFQHIGAKTIDVVEFGKQILESIGFSQHITAFVNGMNKKLNR